MPQFRRDDDASIFSENLVKLAIIYVCGFLAFVILLAMASELGASGATIALVLTAFTLSTYCLVGVLSRTRDVREMLVASRRVPAFHNGMALAAEWTTAAGFLGLVGTLYVLGFDALAFLLGMMAGLVLMGVLIVPYLRKLGACSVPDFFARRYGGPSRLVAVVVIVIASFGLLVAQLCAGGIVASRFLGLPYEWGVWGGLGVLVLSTLLGGMAAVTWTQVAQCIVLIGALLTPPILVSLGLYKIPVPPVAYGAALAEIAALETSLVERQLADAATLKPHASPFLQLGLTNFLALTLCMMVGTASLPHLIRHPLTAPTVRDARLSVAWGSFFVLLVAITLPAYAAFAKLNVLGLVDKATTFENLPSWVESASRRDLVRIHGVSLRLVDDTASALGSGAADAAGVGEDLKSKSPASARLFAGLKETVRTAVIDAALASKDGTEEDRWHAFRSTVLPAAAKADGNTSGALVEASLWIDPTAIVFLLPEMFAQPKIVSALLAAGAIAAALATAAGVLMSLAVAFGHDLYAGMVDRNAPPGRRMAAVRLFLILVASGAAYAALVRPADFVAIVAWSLSLAAAGLFPALVLGIWWKRANVWGATLGMITGFGVCLYYMAGTQFSPVAFHELWSGLVPTSEVALEKLQRLKDIWGFSEGEARSTLWAALEAAARGTALEAGGASWFGIPHTAAGVFALPIGFLVVIVVSLITPKPSAETMALVDEMRIPRGPEILDRERADDEAGLG